MATLGDTTTDKRLAFIKYVTDNLRFAEVEYEIEKDKPGQLFKLKGTGVESVGKEIRPGTKLKITSQKLIEISGVKYAEVSIKGAPKGLLAINKIRKPTVGNGTQYEDEVVDAINSFILDVGYPIDIKIKNKTYENMLYAVKVDSNMKRAKNIKGDPKADIIICEDREDPFAKTSIYVSHKKDGGPEVFQQYGGLSAQAGTNISDHKLVKKFLGKVAEVIGTSKQLPAPVMMEFNNPLLSNLSIYGPEYGGAFSLQHVNIIAQGKPVFKLIKEGVYQLTFTGPMSGSGDLSHFSGGYTPVFGATFRAGRGFDYNGKRYDGARVAIYPQKLMATRSGLIKLKA